MQCSKGETIAPMRCAHRHHPRRFTYKASRIRRYLWRIFAPHLPLQDQHDHLERPYPPPYYSSRSPRTLGRVRLRTHNVESRKRTLFTSSYMGLGSGRRFIRSSNQHNRVMGHLLKQGSDIEVAMGRQSGGPPTPASLQGDCHYPSSPSSTKPNLSLSPTPLALARLGLSEYTNTIPPKGPYHPWDTHTHTDRPLPSGEEATSKGADDPAILPFR